jgi:hypothetical protein
MAIGSFRIAALVIDQRHRLDESMECEGQNQENLIVQSSRRGKATNHSYALIRAFMQLILGKSVSLLAQLFSDSDFPFSAFPVIGEIIE